jgi:serine phosphatase RsbU (regulator of sigma subunit)/catechol 2,3-dioxygenase-like lactoylglutathione lyase family enzyme
MDNHVDAHVCPTRDHRTYNRPMGSFPLSQGTGKSEVRLDRQARHLRMHAIKVFVRDQEQSLRFYVDQLGFKVAFDALLQTGDRWIAVSPPDGTAVITLVAPKPGSREYELIGRSTGVVFVTENVAAQYGEWRKRGVRFQYAPRLRRVTYEREAPPADAAAVVSIPGEEQSSAWGGVFTHFRDLDGNSFELVGFDEVTREVDAQRRAIAEKTESEHRAAQELDIATRVQAGLFPQTLPSIRTLDYAGICIQARKVGGDYYDFLDLGLGRYALIIGDISGKGIAAALLMANLQANLRSQSAMAINDPQRLLRSVNRLFCENTTDIAYATLFFAEFDDHAGRLRYVNCGHLAPVLLRNDGTVEKLASTSTVLGLFREWDCSTGECRIFSGDILALYTDGITESFNDAEEDFGEQRLIDALRRHKELPAQALMESIVDEVRLFSPGEQHDDITLIVAKCRGDGN